MKVPASLTSLYQNHRKLLLAGLLAVGVITSVSTFASSDVDKDKVDITSPKVNQRMATDFGITYKYKPKKGRDKVNVQLYLDGHMIDNRIESGHTFTGTAARNYKFRTGRDAANRLSDKFDNDLLSNGKHGIAVTVRQGTQPGSGVVIKRASRSFSVANHALATTSHGRNKFKIRLRGPAAAVSAPTDPGVEQAPADTPTSEDPPAETDTDLVGEPASGTISTDPTATDPAAADPQAFRPNSSLLAGFVGIAEAHKGDHGNIEVKTYVDSAAAGVNNIPLGGVKVWARLAGKQGCDNSLTNFTSSGAADRGRVTFHACPVANNYTLTVSRSVKDAHGNVYNVIDDSKNTQVHKNQTSVVTFSYRKAANPAPVSRPPVQSGGARPPASSGGTSAGGGTTAGQKNYWENQPPLLTLNKITANEATVSAYKLAYINRKNTSGIGAITARVDGKVTGNFTSSTISSNVRQHKLGLGNLADGQNHTVQLTLTAVGGSSSSITVEVTGVPGATGGGGTTDGNPPVGDTGAGDTGTGGGTNPGDTGSGSGSGDTGSGSGSGSGDTGAGDTGGTDTGAGGGTTNPGDTGTGGGTATETPAAGDTSTGGDTPPRCLGPNCGPVHATPGSTSNPTNAGNTSNGTGSVVGGSTDQQTGDVKEASGPAKVLSAVTDKIGELPQTGQSALGALLLVLALAGAYYGVRAYRNRK